MALPNPRFEASFERLFGEHVGLADEADAFFEHFYACFLKQPGVAQLFASTDMTRQVGMLKKSLFHLVSFHVVGSPNAELARLAALHRRLGIGPQMFDGWLSALIETVRKFDPECDDAVELAWCWALTPGITYMRIELER